MLRLLERSPIRTELQESLRLAIPLISAQVAQSATGFVDTVMMGWLGQEALAAGRLATTTFSTLLVSATGVVMAVMYAVTAYLMGVLGTEALAAYQIVIQTIVILFMVPVGIGYATTIRVGQWHGQQNPQGVKQAAYVSMCLGAMFMALTAVLLLGFPKFLIALYLSVDNLDNARIISLATAMFAISAFSQLFDGVQTTAAGALRGLQDTRVPTLLSFLAFWIIGLTSGYMLGFILNFGSIGLWVGQSLGVAMSALVFVWRLRQLMSKLSYSRNLRETGDRSNAISDR